MLRKIGMLVGSLFFSLWAGLALAQGTQSGTVKKWDPKTPRVNTQKAPPGTAAEPCVEGKNCMDLYGVKTPAEAKKLIELNKQRVIKKRVGPGPVA